MRDGQPIWSDVGTWSFIKEVFVAVRPAARHFALYAAIFALPAMARAQEAAGILHCTASGHSTPIVGAYRHLDCAYERTGRATEMYSGYTGFTATSTGADATRPLAFDVFSKHPESLADLEGRYRLASWRSIDGAGQSSIGEALRGGRDDDVELRPLVGGSPLLAPANALLGLAQIELAYRGETGHRQSSQADD